MLGAQGLLWLTTVTQAGRCAIPSRAITSEQRVQLHDLMLDAYHSWHALDALLWNKLDIRLSSIAADTKGMDEIVHTVIDKAEERGWLHALITAMLEDRPDRSELRLWAEKIARLESNLDSDEVSTGARQGPTPMSFDLVELRQLVEDALDAVRNAAPNGGAAHTDPTFDSLEIGASAVTFWLSLRMSHRRILLRVERSGRIKPFERDRFRDEVKRAREVLTHPCVPKLLGAGFTEIGYLFVIQLFEQKVIKYSLPLPVERVIDIGVKLADALNYAHNQCATFGDIEPSHILLTSDGNPLLSLPHLPVFNSPADRFLAEANDVYKLSAALFAMLPLQPTEGKDAETGNLLETKTRELLRSGMHAEPKHRLTAPALHAQLNTLKRGATGTQSDLNISAKFTVRSANSFTETEIVLTTGDLFSESADIVIAFSDTFDTATAGNLVINSSSLQGQLLGRLYDGNVEALDHDLDQALASMPPTTWETRDDKVLGKLRRYPIGTVAVLELSERRIFAVAVSRMGNDLNAHSSPGFLQAGLNRLWDNVRDSGGRPVSMPIIGSGLSRIGMSKEYLLGEIITSFRAQTQMNPVCPELRIIIHPSDLKSIDIIGIASSILGL